MAGLVGYQNISKGLFQMLMQAERNVNADAQEAALEAAIAGEEKIKQVIATTPSSLSPGKTNRNWTYNMTNSVDSDVKRRGTTISLRAGWLYNKEGYFLIQNDGGNVNGTTITPMNALMAGHQAMLDTLKGWGIKVQ